MRSSCNDVRRSPSVKTRRPSSPSVGSARPCWVRSSTASSFSPSASASSCRLLSASSPSNVRAPAQLFAPSSYSLNSTGVENPRLVLIIGCIGFALNVISATILHGRHMCYALRPYALTLTSTQSMTRTSRVSPIHLKHQPLIHRQTQR